MRETGYQGDTTKTALDAEMPRAIPCLPSCFAELQLPITPWGRSYTPEQELHPTADPADGDAGSTSKTYDLIFGWCCMEPGVGLHDLHMSLPTWDVL